MCRNAATRLRSSAVRLRIHDSPLLRTNHYGFRAFSSDNTGSSKSSKNDQTTSQQQSEVEEKNAAAEDPTKEIVLTPGEKVVVASRLTMWAGIAVFASFCAYYIIRELLPT